VVFEAGLAATSLTWCLVQPAVAQFARTLSYDRAGLGWSEASGLDATAANAAEDLARLLDAVGIEEPVILVGHSFGGLIARVFQQRYPERVAGLVLAEPVVRAEWRDLNGPHGAEQRNRLAHGVRLSRRGAFLARLGVVRFALGLLVRGSRYVPKLVARVTAGRGMGVAERLVGEVRKIPRELWPAIAEHWSRAGSFEVMANGLERLPVSMGQVEEGRGLGSLPVTVLSAANVSTIGLAEHEAEARLSSSGQQEIVPGTGHWIPFDAPEVISEAIRLIGSTE